MNFQQALSDLSGKFQLDAAGLVALADLQSIAKWTAITAPSLSGGELPPTGALTSGYVFRIENEATVHFLQSVGKTGNLLNLVVDLPPTTIKEKLRCLIESPGKTLLFLYAIGQILTVAVIIILALLEDWWALVTLAMWMTARICNTWSIKIRSHIDWKGETEPGVNGDLLILLTQDRWIRLRGTVDDLKAVTSGQWLRDKTLLDELLITFSTLMVYLSAVISGNSSIMGSLCLLCLMLVSAGLLELCTGLSKGFRMYGRMLKVVGKPTPYTRRLDLAEELIQETGRDDWAIGLGMILKPTGRGEGPVLL
ncbi:hypothetical protein DTO013E5_3097 [Penicillium roqueforti]|uniref:uncharacterized protein n=1 Tax=Penicillium roqueforti TaxID=5082 RepID=UPI00190BCD28|nr:uncharacterized protein LCP9604111_2854 [Penicillium roqueforti]KAF9250650.1 hypothetical protein LCP9604111_2854 [Penicillium roqueforti]KAI2677918.1 hypothetical protein CBS147355_4919 [Penicillium roqueforti]KAI2686731.1 hypothetical protein LCP963914a_4331 [Penicillium roqueforti]KAI2704282.1 hypothetical protein CBS147372_2751 [Penicillium roqueforti]KAI2743831.1 hypothetical protein DTO012A1_2817 [Penicillium roqueforti]